jgi:opacity protein-like surface antigen
LSFAVAAPASAQEQKGDVAFGYSLIHDSELEETFPMGWAFAANGNLNDMFSVVGEIGGNYKTVDVFGTDFSFRVHSFMGGMRFRNDQGKAVPFAQVVLGLARLNASFLGESESSNEFAIQPGGGVDFRVTDRFAVRVQGDYRIITGEDSWNEFRFGVGGVLGFGSR